MTISDPIMIYNDLALQRKKAIRRLYRLLYGKISLPTFSAIDDARDRLTLLALDRYYEWSKIGDIRDRYAQFAFDISNVMDYHCFASQAFHLNVPDRIHHWLLRNAKVHPDDQLIMIFDLFGVSRQSLPYVTDCSTYNSRV